MCIKLAYSSKCDEFTVQDKDEGEVDKETEPRKEFGNGVYRSDLMTDQDIMACTSPEKIWKKISNKASEGGLNFMGAPALVLHIMICSCCTQRTCLRFYDLRNNADSAGADAARGRLFEEAFVKQPCDLPSFLFNALVE